MERVLAEIKIRRNGECIMPKKIRDYLELKEGDRIAIILDQGKIFIKKVETSYKNFELKNNGR